jgi:hypothetical protein
LSPLNTVLNGRCRIRLSGFDGLFDAKAFGMKSGDTETIPDMR